MRKALRALGPNGKRSIIDPVADAAVDILPEYEITTPLRLAHFWAQMSHECAGFRTLHEYWGPTDAQRRYEGRRDLGNTQQGDGYRFRGRGIIQLTGRANYVTFGKRLGIDLVNNPELAADPKVALRVACEYWKSRGLNALADKNDIKGITRKINGGQNGLADRRANYVIAWRVFGGGEGLPKTERQVASTKDATATVATGGGAAIGVGAAYELGKEAVSNASDIRETAEGAGTLVGFDGSMALLAGAVLIIAVGVGFLLYRNWKRKREEEG
jgi:putative chitinase